MRKMIDESNIAILKKIREDLDTLSLDDSQAWKTAADRVAFMSGELPELPHGLTQLLAYCRRGIEAVSDHTAGDPLGLVDTIAGALEVAENSPGQDPAGDAAVAEALAALSALLDAGGPEGRQSHETAADADAAGTAADADTEPIDYMPQDADLELLGEFVTEASDLLTSAEEALLTLETDPQDVDAVGTIFRAFHTVKGTAGFLDLSLLAEMGHHAESLLSRVRDREIQYAGGYADLSLKALDMLKELVQGVEAALGNAPLTKPAAYDDLMAVLADPEAAGVTDMPDETQLPRVGDILVAQGKIDREKLEQVASTCIEEPLGVCLVKSKAASVEDVGKALRTQERMKNAGAVLESSVRVGTNRLDRLIDMVGELVVAHSMIAQNEFVVNGNNHELQKKVGHTSKIVRELQDISMSMRMIPLKGTFQKMTRLVRDLSRKVGKTVRLITEGEDTEIDRNMVDIINDPLVHMIRNAVDHGIEAPDVRERAGKPPTGEIHLSAYHSAGNVVVEIRDDGKGLDREAILAKAVERGIISSVDGVSRRDTYNLIFEAGFSTAQTVTDVSGRGVGMDVVKKNLEALRGQVEIQSEAGQGSVFKMRLPLTLAIIDGMVVRVGRERYVIPTVSIVKTVKPEASEISTLLQKGEMFHLQQGLIPICRLHEVFDIQDANRDTDKGLILVVESNVKRTGLLIDELLGRQQVVIKTLGDTLRNIPGISGGAVLPDGCVGLIIDVDGLMKLATADKGGSSGQRQTGNLDGVLNQLPV